MAESGKGVAIENFEAYGYARDNGHTKFIRKARLCEDFFAGEQWKEAVRLRLEAKNKPVLTFNKTLSTVATILGEQISNRADIAYLPTRGGTPETADALNTVYLQIASNNKLDWRESEVFADGVITSRGYYDIRLDFDDHMQGEVRITHLNPVNVVIDPDAESYDPDDWNEVFVTKWLSLDMISEIYGAKFKKRLEGRNESSLPVGFDSIDKYQLGFGGPDRPYDATGHQANTPIRRRYRVIERQHRKFATVKFLVDPETGDMREVPGDWSEQEIQESADRTGMEVMSRRMRKIRWTVSVDDVLLFDEWSPYVHFTIVPYFPYFRRGRTMGVVEHLVSPQELYNKVRSQMLHVINTTSNSGWKIKQGSLRNMTVEELMERGAETGIVLELDDPSSAEKITPNPIPTGLDRVGFEADEDMKNISGVSDAQRGFARADVAARAIEAQQQVGSLNFAKPLDNLAQTRDIMARVILSLVQHYYTEERVIQITGNNLTAEPQEITVNQSVEDPDTGAIEVINDLTLGEYSVRVTSTPHRETLDQGAFQQALEMRREGIPIPDDVLVELSNVPRKGEIAKKIKELQGGGEVTPEQQQMQQLEVALKDAEVKKTASEAAENQAKAQLAQVKAQVEMAQAQDGGDGAAAAALAKVQGELELKSEELQMEREEMERKLELLQTELQMKQEDMAEKRLLERAIRLEQLEIQREQAQGQIGVQEERADADIELGKAKLKQDGEIKRQQVKENARVKRAEQKRDAGVRGGGRSSNS